MAGGFEGSKRGHIYREESHKFSFPQILEVKPLIWCSGLVGAPTRLLQRRGLIEETGADLIQNPVLAFSWMGDSSGQSQTVSILVSLRCNQT